MKKLLKKGRICDGYMASNAGTCKNIRKATKENGLRRK